MLEPDILNSSGGKSASDVRLDEIAESIRRIEKYAETIDYHQRNMDSLGPGWSFYPTIVRNITVPASGTARIVDAKVEVGRLVFVSLQVDDPYAQLVLTLDDTVFSGSPIALFGLGFVQPMAGAMWLSVYNTLFDIYVVNFTPYEPLEYREQYYADILDITGNGLNAFAIYTRWVLAPKNPQF